MLWLWWRWSKNFVWLNNRIFLCVRDAGVMPLNANSRMVCRPGAMNSVAGIVSTLVNVYGVQHGVFVTTSRVTLIVTVAAAVVLGALTLTYSLFLLKNVKSAHNRQVGRERAGRHGEGILEEMKRKANEVEPEAGMV